MPTVKYEFKLPEETEELEIYRKASDYYCAVFEVREKIGRLLRGKTGLDVDEGPIRDFLEEIRKDLWECE